MNPFTFRMVAAVVVSSLISGVHVYSYTSTNVAVDSNLLAYDGKLLFVQGTGSLTRLDLNSGRVLNRITPPDNLSFGNRLLRHRLGILSSAYRQCALLDEVSLQVVWSASGGYDAAIGDNYFVTHDGFNTVQCFEVATGKKVWSKTMEGGWRLLARGDIALIGTPSGFEKGDQLVVVDMPTGDERFRLQADGSEFFLSYYLDDTSAYALVGENGPDVLPFNAVPAELRAYSLSGKLQSTFDLTSKEVLWRHGHKTAGNGFFVGASYFDGDGVRKAYEHEPEDWQKVWGRENSTAASLPSGVLVEEVFRDSVGASGTLISFLRKDAAWRGWITYLVEGGLLWQQIEADGNLIIASGRGEVECIDVATGSSKWVYVFPVIRRTVSYSTNAMPPTLTQQAASYRAGLQSLRGIAGTLLLEDGVEPAKLVMSTMRDLHPYAGTIVVDPSPDDPFAELLPKLMLRAAAFAAFPLIVFAGVTLGLSKWRRRGCGSGLSARDYRVIGVGTFCLALSPLLGVLRYGRVDHTLTLVLYGIALLCVSAGVVCEMIANRKKKLAS